MEGYRGKAALVTGAGNGIGAAVSVKLVSFGMIVYGCDRDNDSLTRLKKEIEDTLLKSSDRSEVATTSASEVATTSGSEVATTSACMENEGKGRFVPVVCNLQNEEEISNMFRVIKQKSGFVNVCVLSAGVGHKAPLLSGQPWMFRNMFEINVLSSVLCAQASVRLMEECGVSDGHIVFINSGAGHSVRVGKPDYADFNFYNATKYALTAITEGLRFELRLANSKIRVSQISPGLVETKFTHSMYPDEGHIIDMLYQSVVSLKPEDVADALIHTLSRPPHIQIHDIFINANGPDRPEDWEQRVDAAKIKSS